MDEGICTTCGETILPHAMSGAERGSCHCPRGPGRIIAHLYYRSEEHPGGLREYDVEWQGQLVAQRIKLPDAEAMLKDLRRAHIDAQLQQEGDGG